MKQRRIWRYYCDHCNKGGCSKAAMIRHEQHCIKNKERSCRMCASGAGGSHTLSELIAALDADGIKGLREAADGCPACMLTAVYHDDKDRIAKGDQPRTGDWSYRDEHAQFWKEANIAKWEGVGY